ncbi:protein MANBAL [Cloeon dipterum]|uniref:Protein anon-73B1 n=1 Tax=Cloeon dipterum TaxID=197152 RepID=A0A8S1BUD9_9INSE|nr:Hypothetical predicted protein [Cloeon dipterum]
MAESEDFNGIIAPDTFMETLLKYGLYIGAVFQLFCIAAIIVIPEKYLDTSKDEGTDEDSNHSSPHNTPRRPHGHHRRKGDKKKRR